MLAVCVLAAGCSAYKSDLLERRSVKASVKDGGVMDAADRADAGGAGVSVGDAADGGATRPDGSTTMPPDKVSCSDGQCWWSHTNDGGCQSAGLPGPDDRPVSTGDVAVDQDVGEIYLGWTEIRLGTSLPDGTAADNAWQGFGLDLDGVCTNSVTCPDVQGAVSCHSAGAQIPFDGELCRDNTFASLQPVAAKVPEIGTRFGLSEDVFNCALWHGSYNVIVRITGYNGELDDPQVRVDFYTSNGLERLPGWDCPVDGYRDTYPLWRTSASWRIDESGLTGPIATPGHLPDSKAADPQAYVREGYLVSTLPDGMILRLAGDAMPYRGFPLTVQHGLWIGNLEKSQDGTWKIQDGLVAGRTLSDDLIKSFREIGFCEGMGLDSFYQDMTTYVRENADLLASGAVDPQAPCDAMSFGIAFQAAELTPGQAGPLEPLLECCPPGSSAEQCLAKCGDGKLSGDERCDTAIASPAAGACPTTCAALDACTPKVVVGTACDTHCVAMPITALTTGDQCCPPGADANQDGDCAAVCGNGVLEPGETCDPIASCPRCVSQNACLNATTTGSAQACTAACALVPVTACVNGDQCCPSGCTKASDNDCPAGCGDGVLDTAAGETCEAGTATPCPSSCDDQESCTTDVQTGSAANCNVVCTHTAITQLHNDDGCCPTGVNANANTDNDCAAVCGNKIVEPGEQCDDGNQIAGDGCAACKTETPYEICLVKDGSNDACAQCSCTSCQNESVACHGDSNATTRAQCNALVACARAHSCTADACYCGTADFLTCLFGGGNGPCQSEVEAAAQSTDPGTISTRSTDTNYPVGRANALGSCASMSCATECGL